MAIIIPYPEFTAWNANKHLRRGRVLAVMAKIYTARTLKLDTQVLVNLASYLVVKWSAYKFSFICEMK